MQQIQLLFIFLFSIVSYSQQEFMTYNNNEIDYKYNPSRKIKDTFNKITPLNYELVLIIQKENDTLFAIYVKNNLKDTLQLRCQDSQLFLLQEAKNEKGEWKPIEYWSYSWCGNSYLGEKLAPQEIITAKSKCYTGSFETEVRFKLLNDGKVLYSNALNGKIELSQFMLSETIKEKTNYYQYEARAGKETAEKILFLEPNGLKEYSEKEKAWQKEMAERRKKKIEK